MTESHSETASRVQAVRRPFLLADIKSSASIRTTPKDVMMPRRRPASVGRASWHRHSGRWVMDNPCCSPTNCMVLPQTEGRSEKIGEDSNFVAQERLPRRGLIQLFNSFLNGCQGCIAPSRPEPGMACSLFTRDEGEKLRKVTLGR